MTYRPSGSTEVKPNTLRDQRAPNTFRSQARPGAEGRQDLNPGGGIAAPRTRLARGRLPLWVYLAVVIVVVYVALLLLSSAA
jgi:type VI protein secretion system component VasF